MGGAHFRTHGNVLLRNRRHKASGPKMFESKSSMTLAAGCGIAVVLIYFIRGTVLPWYSHVPDMLWSLGQLLILLVTAGLVVCDGGNWRWPWLLVLLVFGLGVCQAEEPISAGLHWFGLALLMLAVGPVIFSPKAVAARLAAWRLAVKGLTTLTGIFVVWYALHLPNLGGQIYFTSFMNQSMLLGPVVGMGVVIASTRALHGRSWRWGLMAFLGLVPLLASGSRLAALATGAAGCFLLIRRKPVLGLMSAMLILLAVFQFLRTNHEVTDNDSTTFTNALAKKGTENSRMDLWQSRIDEFKSSPLIGIGIGMGSGSGASQNSDGSIRIEPGSSYLAILSMTGGLGTIAFFSALGMLLYGFYHTKSPLPLDKDILSVVGVFLAVHGVAEGWILGFGSPLCFLFWLWLGSVGDAVFRLFPGCELAGLSDDRPVSGVKDPMRSKFGGRGIFLRRYCQI